MFIHTFLIIWNTIAIIVCVKVIWYAITIIVIIQVIRDSISIRIN